MALIPLVGVRLWRAGLLAMLPVAAAYGEVTQKKIDDARKAIEKVYAEKEAYERLYTAHPEAGMEQELKRIYEVSRLKNPKIPPTRPSRYKPQAMPGNVVLWWNSASISGTNGRFNSLAWIDNERVLLVGSESPRQFRNSMYVWHTGQGTVTPYSDHKYFCYADGYLVSLSGNNLNQVRLGKLGQEKLLELSAAFENKSFTLDLQCRESDRFYKLQPLGPTSGIIADLGRRDGLIAAPVTMISTNLNDPPAKQLETSRMPMRLINDHHPQGIPLPILSLEEIRLVTYSEYRQRYVAITRYPKYYNPWGGPKEWEDATPRPVYLIGSDGGSETIEIPLTAGWSELKKLVPTRKGWVFLGWGVKGNRSGGAFLYDGEQVLALDLGMGENLAASPDGCKVVYAISNEADRAGASADERNSAHFKFINFCQE